MSSDVDPKLARFADYFLTHRMKGFAKDIAICLTGRPREDDPNVNTHAYFPALMTCCGTLELLGSLHHGDAHHSDAKWVARYCKDFMVRPEDYTKQTIILLLEVVRHGTAHLGIAKAVAQPRCGEYRDKRITWTVWEGACQPNVHLRREPDILDSELRPWKCDFEYRLSVHLQGLFEDIRDSVLRPGRYRDTVMTDAKLLEKFEAAAKHIYPESTQETTGNPSTPVKG